MVFLEFQSGPCHREDLALSSLNSIMTFRCCHRFSFSGGLSFSGWGLGFASGCSSLFPGALDSHLKGMWSTCLRASSGWRNPSGFCYYQSQPISSNISYLEISPLKFKDLKLSLLNFFRLTDGCRPSDYSCYLMFSEWSRLTTIIFFLVEA